MFNQEKDIPLIVDLDGALVRSDMLWESILNLVKKKPVHLFMLPIWLLGGKKNLKIKLANTIRPTIDHLPYFQPLLNYLHKENERGRKLILASASDERIVADVANHLGIFHEVIGTTQAMNLRGNNKLKIIKEKLGDTPFDYVGNEPVDIPIWKASRKIIAITNSKLLIIRLKRMTENLLVLKPQLSISAFVKALRVHQWTKNFIIFLPFFLAHEPLTLQSFFPLFTAFLAMSFCASSVYIINDLFDLDSDRHHSVKCKRPFASGTLSIQSGFFLSFSCLYFSFSISLFFLPIYYSFFLISYLILALFYTLVIKKMLIVDVLVLSAFYVLRIFSGGVVADVELSPWLLACSSFFFLNLAFAKRYIELYEFKIRSNKKLFGRNYQIEDMQIILSSGLASGYLSVLIFFLYIANSIKVNQLYKNPNFLWFIGPLLLYWLTRIWILAQRGELHSDPVHFAVKDLVSWIVACLTIVFVVLGAVF